MIDEVGLGRFANLLSFGIIALLIAYHLLAAPARRAD
jgi:hypothetical protein